MFEKKLLLFQTFKQQCGEIEELMYINKVWSRLEDSLITQY